MPIDPHVVAAGVGNPWNVAYDLGDLKRRVASLEAVRTQIGADSISGAAIAPNSITTTEIAAGTIQASDIQSGTITATQIAASTITAGNIAANTITATQIAAGTITGTQIAAGTINTAHLVAASIDASVIAANAITTNAIQAGAVTAVKIATDTITATQIAAGAITTSELAANSVTASAIVAGTIDSTKLNVTTLSSITSNMGAITAGTITGGTIQTAASGSRTVMDSAGLRGYALDGVTKVFEINSGSGIASFTGVGTLSTSSVVPALTIASGGANGTLGGGNMLPNSSFENSTLFYTGWQGASSTMAAETTIVRNSPTSMKITLTSTGNIGLALQDSYSPPVSIGQHYIASAWVYSPTATSYRIYAQTRTAANVSVDTASAATAVPANTWTRIFTPILTPTGASVKCRVLVYAEAGTNGQVYYVDDVQFEQGDVPTAYTPRPDEILPGTVGTNEIAANAVTAAKIAANTITATQIATGTLTALQIAGGTITGNEIAAGTITASKLTVDWGGSNILWDSSFEDNTSSPGMWEVTNSTLTKPNADIVPVSGGRVGKLVCTNGSSSPVLLSSNDPSIAVDPNTGTGPYGPSNSFPGMYPILKGKQYTLSAYVSSPAVIRNVFVRIYWWDGLYRIELPAPTLNSVTAIAGGSLTASTTYYYKVTALNANGETVGSAQLSTATTGTNKTITVNATMPADAQGTDYPVTKWRIYRSTVNGVFTAGYIEQTATGGAVVSFNDTGTALTAGSIPAVGTAKTVFDDLVNGTSIPTELPTTAPNPPVTTSPTVVTGPFVVTGAAGGTLWSRWVRPTVTATPPTGAAFARVALIVTGPALNEVHYVDAMQFERGDIATGYSRRVGEVLPGEVGATQITPNSITTNQVLAAGINADRIVSASITATQIAANTIDAGKLSVATLSAITANMGTLTAGTITGATFQTAAGTTSAVRFDSTGIKAYDASSVNTFNLSSTGALDMTGHLTSTGIDVPEPVTSAFANIPPAANQARWLQGATSRSWVGGDWVSATTPIPIDIHRMSVVGQDRVWVQTGSTYSSPTTRLDLDGQASTASIKAGSQQLTLLDSSQNSHYVQIPGSAAKRRINAGSGSVTFSASSTSNTVTVAHGLGVAPLSAVVSGAAGLVWATWELTTDATNIYVQALGNASVSGTKVFNWMVFG